MPVRLGIDVTTKQPITVDAPYLKNGLYILGLNGTGKSITIEQMAVADMEAGRGVIAMDPHGSLIDRLLTRLPAHLEDRLELLDAGASPPTFGINPFYCPNPRDEGLVDRYATQVYGIFRKVWEDSWGAYLEDIIPNVAHLLLANSPRCTMLDFTRVLRDADYRESLLERVTNPEVRDFWQYEYKPKRDGSPPEQAESTLRRVRMFTRDSRMRAILGHRIPTVDFHRMMDAKNIVLLKLPEQPDLGTQNVALLGTTLLRMLMNAAFARQREQGFPDQIMFYADEFQRFASTDFGRLLDEARKTGVTTVIAHQRRPQLTDRNVRDATGGARNVMVFQVTPDDAAEMVKAFDCTPPPPPEVPVRNAWDYLRKNPPVSDVIASATRKLTDEFATLDLRLNSVVHRERDRYNPASVRQNLQLLVQRVIAAMNDYWYEMMQVGVAYRRGDDEQRLKQMVARLTENPPIHDALIDCTQHIMLGPTVMSATRDLTDEEIDRAHDVANRFMNLIFTLGSELFQYPILERTDAGPTEAQLRTQLRNILATQDTFYCFARLMGPEGFEQYPLKLALPPSHGFDRAKIDRLTRRAQAGMPPLPNDDDTQDDDGLPGLPAWLNPVPPPRNGGNAATPPSVPPSLPPSSGRKPPVSRQSS